MVILPKRWNLLGSSLACLKMQSFAFFGHQSFDIKGTERKQIFWESLNERPGSPIPSFSLSHNLLISSRMNALEMIVGLASPGPPVESTNLASPSPDILQKAAVLLDWLAFASALPMRAWTKPL